MSIISGNVKPFADSGYSIGQSLRLNDDDSAFMSRTPSVAGNRKTWTWSGWVKKSDTTFRAIFSAGTTPNGIYIEEGTGTYGIGVDGYYNGTRVLRYTTALFRDFSAWYHVHIVVDTTQSVDTDRLKIYVNGTEMATTATVGTYPALNSDSIINSNTIHSVGRRQNVPDGYMDGYLSEIYFIDGQALTPDNFGEFDATYGHWKPIKYTGTYGANGFYLPFDDAGFIGKDASTTLGTELITNGTFDTDTTGWTASYLWSGGGSGTISFESGGYLRITNNGIANASAYQALTGLTIGNSYTVAFTPIGGTTSSQMSIGTGFVTTSAYDVANFGAGVYRGTFTATATTHYVSISTGNATNGLYTIIDNVSAKEIVTQGNDFTATNLSATDIVLDSPTNNYATFNNLTRNTSVSFSEGNLKITRNTSGFYNEASNIQMSDGLYYSEFLCLHNYLAVGICDGKESVSNSFVYYGFNGQYLLNWGTVGTHSTYTSGDIIGVAFNNSTGLIEFFKNGVSQGSYSTGLSGISPFFYATAGSSVASAFAVANFGQDSSFAGNKTPQGYTDANGIGDFYYAPPAGYLALCTANLPEPTVVPSEHFDVVTYVGNSSTQDINTTMKPELVWCKSRNSTPNHVLEDIVRGAGNGLFSSLTNAELYMPDSITTFNESSVSFGADTNNGVNGSGYNYVAWLWKAGGTPVVNNDGTIQSLVSANVDAGFSIVGYTSGTSVNDTVGHGLNQAPEIVITKRRLSADNWYVYTTAIDGSYDYLRLNDTGVKSDIAISSPTSSVFTTNDGVQQSTIAYCFHSVEGYSKIGKYVGNGSADGTFVYCGFRPKYVMVKKTSAIGNFAIWDTSRDIDNVVVYDLLANSSAAESTTDDDIDILSNGFKARRNADMFNASGGTYIFMAFAETPFKFSNGR